MAIARKNILNNTLSYMNGLPDWSNMAVIEQWRYSDNANNADDNINTSNTWDLLKKSIVANTNSNAPIDTVDDILTTDSSYGHNSYIYRAIAPCYICQLSKLDHRDSHSDCICVVGDSIDALKDGYESTYKDHRAILAMNIDGEWGANWMVPILPKSNHFYFRFGAITSYGLELCIIPIFGSGLTGKQCYINTGIRGTRTIATYLSYRTYLSNIIKSL